MRGGGSNISSGLRATPPLFSPPCRSRSGWRRSDRVWHLAEPLRIFLGQFCTRRLSPVQSGPAEDSQGATSPATPGCARLSAPLRCALSGASWRAPARGSFVSALPLLSRSQPLSLYASAPPPGTPPLRPSLPPLWPSPSPALLLKHPVEPPSALFPPPRLPSPPRPRHSWLRRRPHSSARDPLTCSSHWCPQRRHPRVFSSPLSVSPFEGRETPGRVTSRPSPTRSGTSSDPPP
mmetsp:Transcript_3335/g.3809  ORF Transcript_3335/g.3809 Transcript_3335/m.3809 type:complete len:235 (+) Transcript_3335:332-1036(+)